VTTPPDTITITLYRGPEIAAIIPALAALRVQVFRAWPYLYDGDEAYEADYLQIYPRSPRAAVVVAKLGGQIVGASTCLPMRDETENVQAPFVACGLDPADFFYFGESVLQPSLRGRGVGVSFFAGREAHARAVSACAYACFCGVVRPADHPARPADFVPLDGFWTRRGFTRRPDLTCRMHWRDIGEPEESEKNLMFWLKSLRGAALPPIATS
jgi:GNAT superfamily N-acetyltransferase